MRARELIESASPELMELSEDLEDNGWRTLIGEMGRGMAVRFWSDAEPWKIFTAKPFGENTFRVDLEACGVDRRDVIRASEFSQFVESPQVRDWPLEDAARDGFAIVPSSGRTRVERDGMVGELEFGPTVALRVYDRGRVLSAWFDFSFSIPEMFEKIEKRAANWSKIMSSLSHSETLSETGYFEGPAAPDMFFFLRLSRDVDFSYGRLLEPVRYPEDGTVPLDDLIAAALRAGWPPAR
jgi:hypothetical protein